MVMLALGLAQRREPGDTAHIALAPRGHAIAQPVLLAGDLPAELVKRHLLLFQHLVPPGLEMREAAIQPPGLAAVQPDDAARELFQKPPVMADQHDAGGKGFQLRFQPFDGRQVEMVGRLVEQQQIRVRRQGARQSGPPRLAAGQVFRLFRAGQAQLLEQVTGAVFLVIRPQPGDDIVHGVGERRKIRLLRQIAHGRAGLQEARAAIEGDLTGGDFQQRRLARAVASDQADALPRPHAKPGAVEQRHGAKGDADIGEQQQRRRGHAGVVAERAAGLKPSPACHDAAATSSPNIHSLKSDPCLGRHPAPARACSGMCPTEWLFRRQEASSGIGSREQLC